MTTQTMQEAKERALKVPVPEFIIDRLRKGKKAFLITGSERDELSGETFVLINERLKKGEPTWAWGRVKFELGRRVTSVDQLSSSERASIDPVMFREFRVRSGPLWLLDMKLITAFPKPKRLKSAPPGRFSSFINLSESVMRDIISDVIPDCENYYGPIHDFEEARMSKAVLDRDGALFDFDFTKENLSHADIFESIKNIKGKFILTLKGESSVRHIFKDYYINESKDNVLLVSNFELLREVTVPSGVHDHPHEPNGGHTHRGLPENTGGHAHDESGGGHNHRDGDPDEGWHTNLQGDDGSHQHILALSNQIPELKIWMDKIVDAHFPSHKWLKGHVQTWIQHVNRDPEPFIATKENWFEHFSLMHTSGMHRFRHEKIFVDEETMSIKKWYEFSDGTKREVTSDDFEAEEAWMQENIPFPVDLF